MEYSMINEPSPSATQASRGINLILVEDGSLHDYPYTKFVSPISLKKAPFLIDFIEKEFGINKNSQLILRGEDGKQLESSMNLEDFFQKDRTVYVYLTKGQRQEIAQDDFEVIGAVSLEKRWSDHGAHLLQAMFENLGPNIRDSLEPHVANCYDDLIVAFSELKGEMAALKEGSIKIKRQKNSEAVLKRSLLNYYIEKKRQFDETLAQQEAKINTFQEYIDNFDSCIEKLSKKDIEPQLVEDDKKHLVDYFDLEKLKRSKGVYEKNQIKIQQKAQEIKDEILQYDNQLKNIEETLPDQSASILELLQVQENLFADAQDTNLQGINQLREAAKGKPSQKQLSDFVKKESETVIPKLKAISQNLVEIRKKLEEYLKENALKLRDLISDITNIRVLIKGKIYNKLKVFCSLVEKHEEGMFNLEIVEKFPLVYEESLQEIRRRCSFKKDYMTMLGLLESFGSSENRLRQDFLEMYQQYLPKTFCPFLSKTFPQLKFDNVKRMIDQDLSIELNVNQQFDEANDGKDILTMMKNLEEALQSKQARNQELENLVQPLKEENEKLIEQLNERVLNVENLRKLLGATGFQERMEGFLGSYKKQLTEKIDKMDQKLNSLKTVIGQSNLKRDGEKSNEIEILKQGLKSKESELEDLKRKTNTDLDNSLCEASTTKAMLEEISAGLRDLYTKLFAGDHIQNNFKNETYDLKEILDSVSKLVLNSMAKIDDYNIGDKVIAVKIKKTKYYLVLRKDMANLNCMHIYKSDNDKLADAIIGEIEEFGVYQEDDITGTNANGIILVKITNIEPLTSILL